MTAAQHLSIAGTMVIKSRHSSMPTLYLCTMKKENLQELQQLHRAKQREATPSFPEAYAPMKKFSDSNTNELTKSIIAFINYIGGFAERINTMGVYQQPKTINVGYGTLTVGKGLYRPTTGVKGSSDISAIYQGKTIKIEVKFGKDRLSPQQIEYIANVTKAGAFAYVAKDYDSFRDWWRSTFDC